jgi:hypothetical protein
MTTSFHEAQVTILMPNYRVRKTAAGRETVT